MRLKLVKSWLAGVPKTFKIICYMVLTGLQGYDIILKRRRKWVESGTARRFGIRSGHLE